MFREAPIGSQAPERSLKARNSKEEEVVLTSNTYFSDFPPVTQYTAWRVKRQHMLKLKLAFTHYTH